ncbi:MAG: HAD-IIB family hydrolase [Clostridia bacterium]|nr:HAD-IIB family hydrolase [Clostridia bacterium]
MGIFEGCLLACDIDGTLLFGNFIPQRNIEKIEYFVSEGGFFSLSTGRTSVALSDITSKIGCISPSVLANGSVIYDFDSSSAITERVLSEKALSMVVEVINTLHIGVEMHTASGLYVPLRSAATDLHEQYESMTAIFTDFKTASKDNINKVIYFLEDEKQYEILLKISEAYLCDCVFYKTSTYIGGVRQNYFEQLPKDVSKAGALSEICKIFHIKKGGFFAIGDYYNDVEMLRRADISAVPCESPDDVKNEATVTVGSVQTGAVADFIEYLEEIFKNGQAN